MINVNLQGNEVLETYENMEEAFGGFFMAFYSWIQIFSIYNTYNLYNLLNNGNSSFIAIFGFSLLTFSLILIIQNLANSVSNAQNAALAFRKRVQDDILYEDRKVKISLKDSFKSKTLLKEKRR